ETLDRSALWAVQTPQVFRRDVLERVLAQDDAVLAAATDDASLVEAQGGTVRVVAVAEPNLKVTTPLDLRVAELLLAERS
ncbi:MAG: 2-C-methyl-D-erythritol 4-phosphate cytidylyltransferase, partial [Solirubrobacteraceae bacterium]